MERTNTEQQKPEKMADFFAGRIEGYDEHMLVNVKGSREGYQKMAELIPLHTRHILDLGCGTGLELEEIFKRLPGVFVTGIDLTPVMLDRLKEKYAGKDIRLICADYFAVDLGNAKYDVAISYQTMHHFRPECKLGLYARILAALKPQGIYIEGDYMLTEKVQQTACWLRKGRSGRPGGCLRMNYTTLIYPVLLRTS